MKVCLIAANSLYMSPFVMRYADLLERQGISYDIISKDHEKNKMSSNDNKSNHYVFYYSDANGTLEKLRRFLDYADYVNDVVSREHYKKVVIFGTFDAVIYYLKNGPGFFRKFEYIIDIRDYNSYLENPVVRLLVHRIIRNAKIVVVSSPEFSVWLPAKTKVQVMHNLPTHLFIENRSMVFSKAMTTIAYFGSTGYFKQNKKIADAVEGTNIFLLYAGTYPEGENMATYSERNRMKNITCLGKFDNRQKHEMYKTVDIINAVYGNDSLIVTTALPNKLYDCAIYKIPIMVHSGTYLEKVVKQYGLGFSIDTETENIVRSIQNYRDHFDAECFNRACEHFLRDVIQEQENTESRLSEFFEEVSLP